MKFLNIDSPLMQTLSKVADLMWLNILTVICCIPVITVGPALTALNYMALKIVRNEECYITKGYFKSFKENFKQATLIWLLFLLVFAIIFMDFYIMYSAPANLSKVVQIMIGVAGILVLMAFMFVFPVLAKFENTLLKTVKNAFLISVMQFPKTVLMIAVYALPAVLFVFAPQIIPLVLLFGLSMPAWASAALYNKFFKKLEDEILGQNGETEEKSEDEEDERIFRDELDPALAENTDITG